MKNVAVIGAGFAGLSAACCLAQQGLNVAVFEKNDSAGGRAREFTSGGFRFDMGPSWYWMPDVFDKFFARFEKKTSSYYSLIRLDPSYRVFFSGDEIQDIPSREDALVNLFEKTEPGSGPLLKKFLDEGRFKYETGMMDMVYKPGLSLLELMDMRLIRSFLKLDIFNSVSTSVKKKFSDHKLIQLLEFPSLFLGAPAARTPALYTLMNYADMVLGTWYPMGGIHKVVEGMVSLAKEMGVNFRYRSPVERFEMQADKIASIQIEGGLLPVDYVVASADYHHVEQQLLPERFRRYSRKYWDARTLAPSCLIFYLGINKKVKNLRHHNLFFDEDFDKHAKAIYDQPAWPDNPLFYVGCTSKTDPSDAPAGHENIFILIPLAPGLVDTEAIRQHYYNEVMNRVEKLTGQAIRDHVVFFRSYAHRDFESDYNAFKGNAYGLANTIRQTAILKPSIENKKVKNLFYTGQFTVPGPGVPPAIISGQVVADELIKRINSDRLQSI
jgi:phytoene desaturase